MLVYSLWIMQVTRMSPDFLKYREDIGHLEVQALDKVDVVC